MAGRVTEPGAWLGERLAGAPEALRARVSDWAPAASSDADLAEDLVAGACRALEEAVGQGRDRAAALDLLAADALVTLGLLRQAETEPEKLASFAQRIRMEEGRAP